MYQKISHMNQHDRTQRSLTPTRSWAANSYPPELPYCSDTQAYYSKTTERSRMDRSVSHFPTLPSPPYFPVLPFSLATLSSRMLICQPRWQPTVAISVLRWLARTRRRWWRVASHKRHPLHIRHCFPWLRCTHKFRHTSSQTACATYVISCYKITEYSVKKTVNMQGMWYSETYSAHSPQTPSFCQLFSRGSQSPCIYNGPWPKAISTRRDCEKHNENVNGN